MSENFDKNRIIKNSAFLYVRMLFTMWLNLYATRLVLRNLGIEDMGVYGIVGSIVSMFTVLTSGISTAVQRFITFEMGRNNGNVNSVFCSSLNVIFLFSALMLILLEVIGLWFLNNKLNIPLRSMEAANWAYQFSVINCIINMISIPYNALIIAKEKMDAFAIISILQVILSCGAAYCISFFDEKLFMYALFMALVSILIRIIYQIYCVARFPEAKFHFRFEKNEVKQLSRFAGVSTASGVLQIISTQGITVVINLTFGVSLNAVYTIAVQIKNSILSFAQNILKAISPQITKTYASGEVEIHKKLVYSGSKMEMFMIYFIMLPFLFRTEYIMKLWLGNVPEYAVIFAQSSIFLSLTYATFEPIRIAVYATNRIAKFMLIPDTAYILVLPICFIIGKIYDNPTIFIIVYVLCDIAICALRIYYAVKVSPIRAKDFLIKTLYPCLKVALFSTPICWLLSSILNENLSGLLLMLIINSLTMCFAIYFIGMSKTEKKQVCNILYSIKEKIK